MKMIKRFIPFVVVFVLVVGLLAQASMEKVLEVFPTGKITDRLAFSVGATFAQQEIDAIRYKEALDAPRDEKDILAGLEGVQVSFENINPKVEKYGLTRQLLQTDTELRLRQHGIRIFTDEEVKQNFIHGLVERDKKNFENLIPKLRSLEESLAGKGSDEHFLQCLRDIIQHSKQQRTTSQLPVLCLNVNAIVFEESHFAAFSIDVQLREVAKIDRNGAFRPAQIWESHGVAGCSSSCLKDYVRECLRDYVDKFINDYLAANPKDRSSQNEQ